MKAPDVVTTLIDPKAGVTYKVLAYRTLSREELISAVRYYLSCNKKRLKRGDEITIISVIA